MLIDNQRSDIVLSITCKLKLLYSYLVPLFTFCVNMYWSLLKTVILYVPLRCSQLTKHWVRLVTIRTGAVCLLLVAKLFGPLFWVLSWRRTQRIPPIDNDIYRISATKLADMIRKREITSEEVVRRYIDRIQKVNPVINAVVQDRFAEAIIEAQNIDKWLLETTKSPEDIEGSKPLLGIPVTVKEACKLKGMSFSVGNKTRSGMVASEDGEAVKKIKEAGGIPLLVSNTPETCFGIECDNLISGPCLNPYNTNYTCGGSSGGEGALLGSGASVVGVGSDLAGSIRIPSLFNGIFGHKPTADLVPNEGHYPFIEDENFKNFLVVGPMVRYAEDLRLMLNVMGRDGIDVTEKVNMESITVHFMQNIDVYYQHSVDFKIQEAILHSVEHLKTRCKSKVSDVRFEEFKESLEMSTAVFFNVQNKPDLMVDQNDPSIRYNFFSELLKLMFRKSTLNYNSLGYTFLHSINKVMASENNFIYYEKVMNDFKDKFINTLGDYGVFLYPTLHTSAFQHKATLFNVLGVTYSMAFNVMGFPSTHVPLGLNEKGLPIGLQVVACPNRDAICLSVAEELERRFGGWTPPPS